jgi:hypothetical protein
MAVPSVGKSTPAGIQCKRCQLEIPDGIGRRLLSMPIARACPHASFFSRPNPAGRWRDRSHHARDPVGGLGGEDRLSQALGVLTS